MRKLISNKDFFCAFSSNIIFVSENRGLTVKCLQIKDNLSLTNGEEQKDSLCSDDCEIITMCLSRENKYLSCATLNKLLYVWRLEDGQLLFTKRLVKKPVALSFTPDSIFILVADKTGDVYKFSINECHSQPEDALKVKLSCEPTAIDGELGPTPILGHLSMLLDMVITYDGKFVATCDRDEKIRVSHFPNAYNIQSFCLGHTEFVSHILEVPSDKNLIVSSSGDGLIKLWNYRKGTCIDTVDTRTQLQTLNIKSTVHHDTKAVENLSTKDDEEELFPHAVLELSIIDLENGASLLAASVNRLKLLLFYTIKDEKLIHKYTLQLNCIPIDFALLHNGEIVILKESSAIASSCQAFSLYRKVESAGLTGLCMEEVSSHPILELGGKYWKELKVCGKFDLDLKLMHKHQFDNLSKYLKQKEERILEKDAKVNVKRIKK